VLWILLQTELEKQPPRLPVFGHFVLF